MKLAPFTTNIAKKAVTQLGKPGALLPVILLEVAVDTGRGVNAYKRGGKTEMRERVTDDVSAGVFWLFGAKYLNKLGDYLGKKLFKIPNPSFSIGKDKAREGLMQGALLNPNISKGKLAAFKLTKVVASIAIAVGFIGWVLPKINQSITKALSDKNENKKQEENKAVIHAQKIFDDFKNYTKPKTKNKPNFGFSISPELIGKIAHNLENNANWRLCATDGGIMVGRTTNARTFDEGLEYGIRDGISSYFYLFATPNIISLFNKFDKYKGKNTKIDPSSAVKVNNYLANVVGDKKMSVEEFERAVFGKFDKQKFNLIESTLKENKGNISVDDFVRLTGADKNLAKKAKLMSKLQAKVNGKAILTDKQAIDVLTDGAITNPRFIYQTTNKYFAETGIKNLFSKAKKKITACGLSNKLHYTPIGDIETMRNNISDYAQSVIEIAKNQAKKLGGNAEISIDTLKKASKRNAILHSTYLGIGLLVSGLFLSTLIPKFQYWVTKKRTGKDGFPGVDESKQAK